MNFDRNYVKIDLDAIEENIDAIRAKAGVDVMAVVKADAYGHGAVPMSHALVDLGAEYLAVSNLEEAVQIRRGGVRAQENRRRDSRIHG